MKLAYIDACVWITLVEGLDRYRPPIRAALATLAEDGWELCSSDAVRLEVLVRPLRMKQGKLVDLYRGLLDTNRTLSILTTVFADALTVASVEGLKAMDAVHVAIAMHHGCERFVTTDPHFNSLKTIAPEWISLPAD
jgi:predicted nucleic acid-binding protein